MAQPAAWCAESNRLAGAAAAVVMVDLLLWGKTDRGRAGWGGCCQWGNESGTSGAIAVPKEIDTNVWSSDESQFFDFFEVGHGLHRLHNKGEVPGGYLVRAVRHAFLGLAQLIRHHAALVRGNR